MASLYRSLLKQLDAEAEGRLLDPPPLRAKKHTPKVTHRIQESQGKPGPSPWEKPRAGFTAAMAARSEEAGSHFAGRRVVGRVNW